MTYDYFYGQQAEMFAFYRVPKVLFTEDCFWNVSTDAKLLYGILLDRMNLSARNGWLDEEGRVYIIFTIEEIKGALGCAEKKAVKLLDELEKKCGLIERKRQGLGKPNLIYVKNFISGSVERQFLNCQKDNSGVVKNTIQELSKAQGNNTDTNYIDFSDTDPFFPSGFCGKEVDETDEFTRYYQYFYEQLSMDYLKQDYLGYPYVWGGSSPSTSFDCSGFVSWVINNCGNGWSVGRLTANGLMGVCDIIPRSSAKPGDLIFFQGTYDTSGASHVGIYVGNGMMIHCGNPISYASIETSYWQQHFYCFGRIRN